ncbi:MAG: hypothetical protein KGJ78_14120 [Alphaproteobacteria bacterium]|nr:hypothetical protein [Alphaproteobacteria bacterium]
MKHLAWLAAAVAALTLGGCYESNGLLLDASAARQPISQYQDWKYGGDTKYHARLNPRSDGWYDYEEAKIAADGSEGTWEHHTVLLNYLENANGLDLYVYATWEDSEKAYVYGVVAVRSDGWWQSVRPDCDSMSGDPKWVGADANAATQAGGTLKSDDAGDSCQFTNSASLFQAMRNVVAEPGFWDRVQAAANG